MYYSFFVPPIIEASTNRSIYTLFNLLVWTLSWQQEGGLDGGKRPFSIDYRLLPLAISRFRSYTLLCPFVCGFGRYGAQDRKRRVCFRSATGALSETRRSWNVLTGCSSTGFVCLLTYKTTDIEICGVRIRSAIYLRQWWVVVVSLEISRLEDETATTYCALLGVRGFKE